MITKHSIEPVRVNHGLFQFSEQVDHIKLAVIERHHLTNQLGLGIGLKSGAIAMTVAHNSHNLIIAGTNDQDMLMAAKEIKKTQGGLAVIQKEKILASLPPPISGLVSK
ncbi:adenine deaminase C-terminal domain-containing protein [Peribacillus sp. CSMR9]|uniref:adenine deaminase C-terminal domain-containing protein n=1 Tax=Peribacillus sp. CSMR9 TaxID=2981350 RepID=UPI0029529660|nr:adenine deaminase C-terminal domain-containing protein [Peribacillus sp. CSMR9]MDV7767327.1 hypothetical protein [Peribacillus sp. CSMR9]